MSGMNYGSFHLFDTVALIVFAYVEAALVPESPDPSNLSANSQLSLK